LIQLIVAGSAMAEGLNNFIGSLFVNAIDQRMPLAIQRIKIRHEPVRFVFHFLSPQT
jgi:hypothetical protein